MKLLSPAICSWWQTKKSNHWWQCPLTITCQNDATYLVQISGGRLVPLCAEHYTNRLKDWRGLVVEL